MVMIVVGAGISGLACAVACAARGARVIVVSDDTYAAPASAVPRAILMPSRRKPETERCFQAYAAWCSGLHQATSIDPCYRRLPAYRLLPADDPRVGSPPPAMLSEMAVDRVSTQRAAEICPASILRALRAQVAQYGGQMVSAGAVSVHLHGRHLRVTLVNGVRVRASQIIIAAGHATNALLASIGVQLPLTAMPGTLATFQTSVHWPAIVLDDHTTLVTSSSGATTLSTTAHAASIPQHIAQRFRSLQSPISYWSAMRVRGPRGNPIVGVLNQAPNIGVATGFGRNGFLLAPFFATCLADKMLNC